MAEQIARQGVHLAPYILQIAGLVGFFVSLAFWIATDKQSALMMGACLSLVGIAEYQKAARRVNEIVGPNSE